MVRTGTSMLLVLVLLAALAAPVQGTDSSTADTLSIVKDDQSPTNAEVAVALSQATPPGDGDTVVIGRDDVFADSLASAVLQRRGPLLLTPPAGPLPLETRLEIQRLGPDRAVLLGGEQAVSPLVEAELAELGIAAVERRQGPTRLETAISVAAEDAPEADTAMLVRGFPSAGAEDSQAFADTLAAGALAAQQGWPVLLTQTETLSDSTREYLQASAVSRVLVLGGTAAISQAVEDEVSALGLTTERVAGDSRFATAVEVAKVAGAADAGDVDRVVLVEGEGSDAWAGGFAAARHAMTFDAPVLLARGAEAEPPLPPGVAGAEPFPLPDPTTTFLEVSIAAFAVDTSPSAVSLTCVTGPGSCEQARRSLGLPPSARVTFTPADNAAVQAGDTIGIDVDSRGRPMTLDATGSCLDETVDRVPSQVNPAIDVLAADVLPAASCDVVVTLSEPDGRQQTVTATYPLPGDAEAEVVSRRADGTPFAATGEDLSADGTTALIASQDEVVAGLGDGNLHLYVRRGGSFEVVDVRPDGSLAQGQAYNSLTRRPRLSADGGHVVFHVNDGGLDPSVPAADGVTAYWRDLEAGDTRVPTLDVDDNLTPAVFWPNISGDGRWVVWASQGAAVPDGSTVGTKVFRRDMVDGTTTAMIDEQGEPITVLSLELGGLNISRDGRFVSFRSTQDLTGEDTPGTDTFVYDFQTAEIELVSRTTAGQPAAGQSPDGSAQGDASADGVVVAFTSDGTNLPGASGTLNAYVRDRSDGSTALVSRSPGGQGLAEDMARSPAISPDGGYVVFITSARTDAAGPAAGCGAYRYEVATGALARVDLLPDGTADPGLCLYRVAVANTGRVLFDRAGQVLLSP